VKKKKLSISHQKRQKNLRQKFRREGNKTIIEIKLPDVEREEDIDVKRLEQSIEIRARAKDKLYFKLVANYWRNRQQKF